ncbi:unnamed protein product [Angiostrongylus costaricensis]|uniref:DUF7808 domain-containing protein n=1 Tax=Angiostrongylus costaricensis TaxID=334426 RepID=A0A0R3PVI7_ANGCS|nr:unnamed protein product [Angiostrongylus costaricensis]
MPQLEWNQLARNSTTRLACPIGCEPEFDLSVNLLRVILSRRIQVITKIPYDNDKCQKYYTYGKYRNRSENEWYLWMTDPCVATLTTHCRFKDVPLNAKSETRKLRQKALVKKL